MPFSRSSEVRSPSQGNGTILAGNPTVLREDLLESLRERWRAYRKALRRCRKRTSEPKVHALRVETRRLLSTLEILGSLVAHARIQKARSKLKRQLDSFDELRDTHVQLLYLREMLSEFPELKWVYRKLRRREKRLVGPAAKRARVCKVGGVERAVERTREHLKAAFAAPSVRCRPKDRIAQVLQAAFDRLVEMRSNIDPADATTIHRTRVAFKKFRYMIELLQPLLPWLKPEQLIAMDEYQTMMGSIQDIEVMMASLKKMSQNKKKGVSFTRVQRLLAQRHSALIRTYVDAADQLFAFWPAPVSHDFPPRPSHDLTSSAHAA